MNDLQQMGLREYLRVLREQRVLIVFVTIVFVAAAVVISSRQEEKYRSEAKIFFEDPAAAGSDFYGNALPARRSVEQLATVGAAVVQEPKVARAVVQRLGRPIDAQIAARPELRTGLVVVQVTATDPQLAAAIANAYAVETRDEVQRDFRREVNAAIEETRSIYRGLRRDRDLRQLREAQIGRLRAIRDTGRAAEVTQRAAPSSTPVSPKPVRNGLFGLIAGLTVALIVAFARASLDRRLKTSTDIAEAAGLPLLGAVRDKALGQFLTPASPDGAQDLEALRIVRRNLELLDLDGSTASVLITSAVPEEGKSTVAAGIAVASALSGKRTLLVECDLRRPVLAERVGIEAEPGIADYIAGSASPADVVRTVALPAAPAAQLNGSGPGPAAHLAVIPAGHAIPQPAELLASEKFGAFLTEVGGVYDLVVLDAPPLLSVSDPLELLGRVDAVVLCARAGRVMRQQLVAARQALARRPDVRIGLVATGISARRGDPDYGSYSYAYSKAYAART